MLTSNNNNGYFSRVKWLISDSQKYGTNVRHTKNVQIFKATKLAL